MNTYEIKIIIVDDHEVLRDGLKVMLAKAKDEKFTVIGEGSNGEQAVELTSSLKPDIVLMDIQMPVMDGIEATKIITEKFQKTKIIALSTFNESSLVLGMIDAGAKGYLLKDANKEEIQLAINIIYQGGAYFTDAVTSHLARAEKNKNSKIETDTFSDRELEVLRLICQGKTSKEIALILCLSKRTIDSHRESIMDKAQTENVIELFNYAVRNGIHKLEQANTKYYFKPIDFDLG